MFAEGLWGLDSTTPGSFTASSTNQFVVIDAAGWQTMSMMLQTLNWTFKVLFSSSVLCVVTVFWCFLLVSRLPGRHFPKASLGRFPLFFPSISTTSRFKYLERLLLLHGRWNYRRACMFTLFTSLGVLGQGPAFDGNRRVKIDGTDPIYWII